MRAEPYRRPQNRLTRFVFTLNNWTQEEYLLLTSAAVTAKMRWMIIAKEVGEQETPHLQGAAVLKTQTAFSTVKTLLGSPRIHLEVMHGSPEQSLAYCSKQDSNPFVFGKLPTQGKRTDLALVAEKVREGATLRDLAKDGEGAVAVVKFHKGLTVLRSLTRPKRDPSKPPIIVWVHGPTGVGKTRSCFELGSKLGDVWISSGGLRWFDGYDGQRCAIFDDFRAKGVSFHFLLRITDRYPMQVEFKGGFVEWTPEFIFFTAPSHPDTMFAKRKEHVPEDIAQLNRRISHIFEFPNDREAFEQALEPFLPRADPPIPALDPTIPGEEDSPELEWEPSLEEFLENI